MKCVVCGRSMPEDDGFMVETDENHEESMCLACGMECMLETMESKGIAIPEKLRAQVKKLRYRDRVDSSSSESREGQV